MLHQEHNPSLLQSSVLGSTSLHWGTLDLAWACALNGDFTAAEVLLEAGEAQLKDVWIFEYGRILCRRVQVLSLQGNQAEAQIALTAAKEIAHAHGDATESDLGQLITQADETMAQ